MAIVLQSYPWVKRSSWFPRRVSEWSRGLLAIRQIEDWACEGVVRDSLTEIDSMLSDKLHVPLFHFSCLNRLTPYELYFDAIEFIWMTFQTCPLPSFVFRYQVEAQLDYGPGSGRISGVSLAPKSGSAGNRSHMVPKTGFQDGGERTRIFTHKIIILVEFMTWYNNFLAWRQRIISLVCFANNAVRPWCRYSTEKCLPDSHLPFVYVVILSISPFWRIGETNPSTKTSKILFSIVMPTFGKSCRRPWLHGLKNQS